jgi:Tol biopolymer transport system component
VFSTYPLGFHLGAKVSHIYTMRPDGTDVRQLTSYKEAEGRASHPRWLPDGSGIVYVLGHPGDRAIWFMTPDGKKRVRIKARGDSWHPAWQPNPEAASLGSKTPSRSSRRLGERPFHAAWTVEVE